MNLDSYRTLLIQARRLTRSSSDAEDLVQDTLIAALQAGRSDVPWLAGTMRRLAAQSVRAIVRRRRREDSVARLAGDAMDLIASATAIPPRLLMMQLPPAARRLATLALHGLNADEIRWILGITPTAFRQRLTSIRKILAQLPEPDCLDEVLADADAAARQSNLPFGLLRRALKAALLGRAGLGTHDIDGHLIVLRPHCHADMDPTKILAHTFAVGGN